ncbi:DUF5668 domain-containing protein [Paucibacter sp. R3-3]|uniref:DUF5668 domain-containing protein n=1 Tax=Roseateles agri TaxID=3098619 RepID=A0ABU5DJ80_9BURK|nr:DUF5668 domain-containing protein [Paucibacter sp. R3-3]MDY0745803.1 DUF5668 domain-containing protein [Paucibacter sp. R3-3]
MFHRQLSRLVIGLFIIGVGLVALLDNARLFDAGVLRPYWPMVLVVLGVVRLFSWRSFFGSAALIFVGLLLTAQNLGYLYLHWRDWWPVLLIIGGASMLLRGSRWDGQRWQRRQLRREARWARRHGMALPAGLGTSTHVDNSDRVDVSTTLGSQVLSNASQNFQGGELSAVMGSIELDLRDAAIAGDAALLVKVVMGGIEIKVPRSWAVSVRAEHVLAGVDDRTVPPVAPAGRLQIGGEVVMGSVTIRN